MGLQKREKMRGAVVSVFGLFLTLAMTMTAVTTVAVGEERGTFPDRTFEVWKAAGGGSFAASIAPSENGMWWVSLESLTGSSATVRVYDVSEGATKSISVSRLYTSGEESEHVSLLEGKSYAVKFSVAGKAARAVLQEHFSGSAIQAHDPILIQADNEFTPANGVVGGQGTQTDPYRISGWYINASTADGVKIVNTNAYFVIENVLVDIGTSDWTQYYGVLLSGVANGFVAQSAFHDVYCGVAIEQSTQIGVLSSTCTQCTFAIRVSGSVDVVVANTVAYDCFGGMIAEHSSSVTFTGNAVTGCEIEGILLDSSTYCSLNGNSFTVGGTYGFGDGILLWGSEVAHYHTHDITPANTVEGRPILYVKDATDVLVENVPVGQLLVANSNNVVASQLVISNTDVAVQLAFVTSASVSQCVMEHDSVGVVAMSSAMVQVSDCVIGPTGVGVYLSSVSGAAVEDCWISSPQEEGVIVSSCNDVLLARNTIEGCQEGLTVDYTTEILISENTITNNGQGVGIAYSDYVIVSGNAVTGNGGGVYLYSCSMADVYGNVFIDNSWGQAYDDNPYANWWTYNYWSDYAGIDANGDDVGDTPYYFEVGAADYAPLISPLQVRVSVITDRHWYSAGEQVNVTMLIANTGAIEVTLAFGSSLQRYILVETFWWTVVYNSWNGISLPVLTYLTIQPGEVLSYAFSWPETADVPSQEYYLLEGIVPCGSPLVLSGLTMVGLY